MPTLALSPIHNKLTKSWCLFAASSIAASLTGTLAETVLARIAFPAAAMGPNGIIVVTVLWSLNNNANSKTFRVRMGPAGFTPPGSGDNRIIEFVATTQQSEQLMNIIRNRNNQAQQVCGAPGSTGIGATGAALGPPLNHTLDTTAAFDLILTGQLANAGDTITLESYMTELFYGA